MGRNAKIAARRLAPLPSAEKNLALLLMAEKVEAKTEFLVAENKKDLDSREITGSLAAVLDRISLNPSRVQAMAQGLRDVAALPDPVREVVKMWRRPNGLQVGRMRIPLGVIGIIYEARPNVTADAAALCLEIRQCGHSSRRQRSAPFQSGDRRGFASSCAETRVPQDAVQVAQQRSRFGRLSCFNWKSISI